MEVPNIQNRNIAGADPVLVADIVNHIKSKGIFDEMRKECLADVDTKPAFQNLRQRVEGFTSKLLSKIEWRADLNKNQLRDNLRNELMNSGMMAHGLDHLVDQVVHQKTSRSFLPKIKEVVYDFLGLPNPQPRLPLLGFPFNVPPPTLPAKKESLLPPGFEKHPETAKDTSKASELVTQKIEAKPALDVSQQSEFIKSETEKEMLVPFSDSSTFSSSSYSSFSQSSAENDKPATKTEQMDKSDLSDGSSNNTRDGVRSSPQSIVEAGNRSETDYEDDGSQVSSTHKHKSSSKKCSDENRADKVKNLARPTSKSKSSTKQLSTSRTEKPDMKQPKDSGGGLASTDPTSYKNSSLKDKKLTMDDATKRTDKKVSKLECPDSKSAAKDHKDDESSWNETPKSVDVEKFSFFANYEASKKAAEKSKSSDSVVKRKLESSAESSKRLKLDSGMKETQESYADDAELRRSSDAQDDGNVSDVTVSSVHTSDLSSYDERISLSSEDELDLNLSILNSSRVVLKLKDRASDAAVDGADDNVSDHSKMGLRRQRKLNPKYTSKDFSSIFNDDKKKSEGRKDVKQTETMSDDRRRHLSNELSSLDSSSRSSSNTSSCKSSGGKRAVPVISDSSSQSSSDSSDSELAAVAEPMSKTTKSAGLINCSQRYESSDLYKPHAAIQSSTRRSRTSTSEASEKSDKTKQAKRRNK